MATVKELMSRFEYLVNDETVDNQKIIDLFNEAQEDLSLVAGYAIMATTTYAAAQNILAMPIDLVDFVEIKYLNDNDPDRNNFKRLQPVGMVITEDTESSQWYLDDISGFKWFGDSLEVLPPPKYSGTLNIYYYAYLPDIPAYDATNSDPCLKFVPALRRSFHRAISIYAAWKYTQNYKDEPEAEDRLGREYTTVRELLKNDTEGRKERGKSKTVFQYRRWE